MVSPRLSIELAIRGVPIAARSHQLLEQAIIWALSLFQLWHSALLEVLALV